MAFLSSEIKDKIIELKNSGKSVKDIVSELKVNINSVYYTLNNYSKKKEPKKEENSTPEQSASVQASEKSSVSGEVPAPQATEVSTEPHKITFNIAKKDIETRPLNEDYKKEETKTEEKKDEGNKTAIKVKRLFEKVPRIKNIIFKKFGISQLTDDEFKEDTEDWKEFAEVWAPALMATDKTATAVNVGLSSGFQLFARLDEIIPAINNLKQTKELIKSDNSPPKENKDLKANQTEKKITNAPPQVEEKKSTDPNTMDYWISPGQRH